MTQKEKTYQNDLYALHLIYTNKIKVDADGTVYDVNGNIIIPHHNTAGYLLIRLPKREKRIINIRHHRLVILAHYGLIPFGMFINHKDENKHNNHIDNLEVVTHAVNMKKRGKMKNIRLTDADATTIIFLYNDGLTIQEINNKYFPRQNYNTINDITRGKCFKHLAHLLTN